MENLREQLEAAKGLRPFDVLLENVKIVNVFTEEIMEGCIGIYGQRIVAVNPKKKEAKTVIDGQGCYAVPGFIDAHIHIETTLLTPEALGDVIIPWGTTSLCVDAMEIANVAGMEGLQALIKDMDQLPFRLYLEIPSRVPTAPGLETTGGVLGVEEVTELLDLPQAISLGELDPSKILGIREEYLAKIAASLSKNKVCNGHAIGLSPEALNVYAAGHLSDDHESVEYEELLDRLRVGIKALIREGSSERNVEKLITGVVQNNLSTENLMYCTDDKHVNDIAREGHISYNIEKSIALGLDPVKAIKIATINAAKHFRMEQDIGSITPGRYADIVLLKDLKTIKPVMVMKGGRVVADVNGAKPCPKKEYPSKLFDSVHISPTFSEHAFNIPAVGQRALCRVIEMIKDQIINNELHEWMQITDGEIRQEVERDILKLSVVERYGKNGRVSNGLVKGFGLKKGALASSVSHDHHNIVVVGANDHDMTVAVKEIERLHGGFVLVCDGKVVDALALPLAGLMTTLDANTVMKRNDELNAKVQEQGCMMAAPFMSLSFISLPTVPKLGLTDFGLIDVLNHKIVDLIIRCED